MKGLIFKYQVIFFIGLFCGTKSGAQVSGGLGHPVLYEHFGLGNSDPSVIGPPLPSWRTHFLYSTSWCPPTGSYTIARTVNVNGCPGENWLFVASDRTSDYDLSMGYGFMMQVNNNTYVNTVYVDTIEADFCPGTVYNFSAAILNLSKDMGCPPAFPSFTFLVEPLVGRFVYMSFTTGPLVYEDPTRALFHVYGQDFTLPAGVTKVMVRIVCNPGTSAVPLCGSDFAIDDIIIQAKGPVVDINFQGQPQQNWVMSACYQQNRTIQIEGRAGAYYSSPAYQWEQSTDGGITWMDIPGANALTYQKTYSVPDTFLYRLRTSEAANIRSLSCGVVSNTLRVEINDVPSDYDVTSNSPVCAGQDLKFNALGGATFIWRGPNGFYDNIQQPHIFFSSLRDSGWYYAEITSLGGCKVTDSTYVVMKGTDVDAEKDTVICKGGSVRLNASKGISYEWTPADGLSGTAIRNPKASPAVTTKYTVTVADKDGCSDTAQVTISVKNKNEVRAVIEGTAWVCRPYDSAFLFSKSTGDINIWNWMFDNGQTSTDENPAVQYYRSPVNRSNYRVSLSVTDTTGCTDTAYHILRVADNCYIAVPTGFTPDNDGLNDFLYPVNAYKATNLFFKVYNRLGQLVFEGRDWSSKWNGKVKGIDQPAGVYVWTLDYTDAAGKRITLKGTSVLIR